MKPRPLTQWAADLSAAWRWHHAAIFGTFAAYGMAIAGAWFQSLPMVLVGLAMMAGGVGACSMSMRARDRVARALQRSALAGFSSILE